MIGQPSQLWPISQLAIDCLTEEDSEDDQRRRRTCCGSFEACLRWIPVCFICAILVYSYYVYVWHLCLQKMSNYVIMGVLLLCYHLLLLMFLWTYWRSIWAQVMPIPDEWSIPEAQWRRLVRADGLVERRRILEAIAGRLPITMCDQNGVVRYCEHCRIIKPDRTHHCRTCDRCILKMDHHCPWLNNCVHFHNYKYFLLFLLYSSLYCLDILITLMHELHHGWGFDMDDMDMDSLLTMIPLCFAIVFSAAALIMLSIHIYLVLVNRTTMESAHSPTFSIHGRTRKAFNLGRGANFCEVFGDKWYLWLLPIYSSRGNGLSFPMYREGSISSVSSAVV